MLLAFESFKLPDSMHAKQLPVYYRALQGDLITEERIPWS